MKHAKLDFVRNFLDGYISINQKQLIGENIGNNKNSRSN